MSAHYGFVSTQTGTHDGVVTINYIIFTIVCYDRNIVRIYLFHLCSQYSFIAGVIIRLRWNQFIYVERFSGF